MRYELFIGLRYLRARRRDAFISLITLISVLGVTIAVMTLEVALSVLTGFERDLRERILGFSPHIIVTSLNGRVKEPESLAAKIRGGAGIEAAEPFVYTQALVSRGGAVTGTYLRGIDPERIDAVIDVSRFVIDGGVERLGETVEVEVPVGDDRDATRTVRLSGVVIGSELARQLGVGGGDVLSLFLPSATPSPVGMIPKVKRFVVVGVFHSGMYEYDAGLVYLGIDDARRLLGMGRSATGIELRVANLDHAGAIAARLNRDLLSFPLEARDWMQMNRNIFVALRLEKVVYFLVLSLMLVVAAFSILATLIMVVMEKRRDVAVLKSMGATNRSIARIFVYKGLLIGAVGTILGNVAGWSLSALIGQIRLPLPEGVFYTPTVPVEIVPAYYGAVTLAAIIVCFLVTLYPASRAARVAPVDVLRYE